MIIELDPVYQCNKCNSIIDNSEILITKTDDFTIKQCPVCGCYDLVLVKEN